MKKLVVAEETEDMVGLEMIEDEDDPEKYIILRDVSEDEDWSPRRDYYIHKEDIPKLIEGLKLFMEE
jgi:hypothetical protein